MRMMAGIPFANSNGKRLGAGRDGEKGKETLWVTLIRQKMSWISSVACRKENTFIRSKIWDISFSNKKLFLYIIIIEFFSKKI